MIKYSNSNLDKIILIIQNLTFPNFKISLFQISKSYILKYSEHICRQCLPVAIDRIFEIAFTGISYLTEWRRWATSSTKRWLLPDKRLLLPVKSWLLPDKRWLLPDKRWLLPATTPNNLVWTNIWAPKMAPPFGAQISDLASTSFGTESLPILRPGTLKQDGNGSSTSQDRML